MAFRRSERPAEDASLSESIGRSARLALVLVSVMLTIGAVLLDRAASGFETSVRHQQARSLAWHVNTTNRAIDLWFGTQERFITRLAAMPELVKLTGQILAGESSPEALAASPVLEQLRGLLESEIDVVDGRGIFVIGPDNVSFASMRNANLGQENFLLHKHPAKIRRAWEGEVVAIPPVRSDVPLGGAADPEADRSLFLAAPILGETGSAIAVLTVRYDARATIDYILRDAERDLDVDAYAFDGTGRFVTQPLHRFKRGPVTGPDHTLGFLDERVAVAGVGGDPGPLTELAERALAGGRGTQSTGYESYSGERVLGAWAWNPRLALGLAAEVSEAYTLDTFAKVHRSIRLLTLLVASLSAGLILSSFVHRHVTRRQARALRLDALTGIACRGHFDARVTREFRFARRSGMPLSLLLIDVDDFKAFNDTYGHPEGDSCLRAIADCLEGACERSNDLAARYGGEEFALLLPMADATRAARIAWGIRQAVRTLNVPHEASRASDHVTVSIGLVTMEAHDGIESHLELIRRADTNLYRAKDQGRNTVVTGTPPAADGAPGLLAAG